MKKKKRKKQSRKKLDAKGRKRDAKKWLFYGIPKDLVVTYVQRYGISTSTTQSKLVELGFEDNLNIQFYKAEGWNGNTNMMGMQVN
ncbi:MAG: hypothetical protein GY845_30540 [Planctomycetes bacterium]|nr:hypothetical protein [Planctomycetota bacterium]